MEASRRIAARDRLEGADALGIDEHVWSPTGQPRIGMITGTVEHSSGPRGPRPVAAPRAGGIRKDLRRLAQRPRGTGSPLAFKRHLDPSSGSANAIRDELARSPHPRFR
ncbi:hypothetical protein D9M72_327030 [compost metagenome]